MQSEYEGILNQYTTIQDYAGDALLPGGTCDRHLENSETVAMSTTASNATSSRMFRRVAGKKPESGFTGAYGNIVRDFEPFAFKEAF